MSPTQEGSSPRRIKSIRAKIILPYLLLTLVVAGVGVFIVTSLVSGSLDERFNNQLLDAGRIVAEHIVNGEKQRLETLRLVTNTTAVATDLVASDQTALDASVRPILLNSPFDAVSLINKEGVEVYGLYRLPDGDAYELRGGNDFSTVPEVQMVLNGVNDSTGSKRVFVAETAVGPRIFTVGPVYQQGELVGAAMVGISLEQTVTDLAASALAKVTFYNPEGVVLATSFVDSEGNAVAVLQEPASQYRLITRLLQTAPTPVVTAVENGSVPLRQVEIVNQTYRLAYGDWQMRGQSFGLFSVALPSNFIVTAAATSRNALSLVFSMAAVAVTAIGLFIARRIVLPLGRLVEVSTAVSQGDLDQRTGIQQADEIGSLAHSFDIMTERLAQRNKELIQQANKLEAILNGIADSVIVLDAQNQIVTANPAAERLLQTWHSDNGTAKNGDGKVLPELLNGEVSPVVAARRFQVGGRFFSGSTSVVNAPDGEQWGRVFVLRDVTREAEAEQLKDGFITQISHELRTPLTSIKGYMDLFKATEKENISPDRMRFLDAVIANTEKLIDHVNKLLDIGEIQQGTIWLQSQPVNLIHLLADLTSVWRDLMAEKGLSFQVNHNGQEVWVKGDRARLTWAINSLVENAYHYTLADGQVAVNLIIDQTEGEARIEVADTGIGIAAVDEPYIFTRFYRVENQSTFNERGVGLGLFIAKSLVEMQNGRIWVHSQPDEGSTFTIALPLESEIERR